MKRITAIMGSHRQKGHTAAVLNRLLESVGDAEITRIDVNTVKAEACRGCDYCISHQGQCVIEDDMTAIHKAILECDVLVIASPVYFSAFPSKLKAIIDRGQVLYALKDKAAIKEKDLVLIGLGGAPEYAHQFDGLKYTLEYYNRNIKARLTTLITIPNTDRVAALDNAEAMKAIDACAATIRAMG